MSTETTEVSPELKRGRNQLAVTVVTGHAIKHVYNSALQSILFPEIKIGMGLSATQLGTLAFSRQATSWITTVAAGYLGDRFANRASLMLGISLSMMGISYYLLGSVDGISQFLPEWLPNFWVLVAIMLLVGVGPSLYHPPAIGALSRRFPDKRGLAISLHGTGGSVGEVVGPIIVGTFLLSYLMWHWSRVLEVSLFPAIIAAILIWALMRNVPGGDTTTLTSTRAYFISLATLLKKKALFVLVIVTALRSVGQSSVSIFLPVYLREDLEFTPSLVAIYLSLAQLVGIVAQPAMGWLADRFGYKWVLVPAMVVMGLLFIALAFADVEPLFWEVSPLTLTVIAIGSVLYSLHAIFIGAAIEVAEGSVQSTIVSLVYGASFLGTLSPVLAGVIADRYGVPSTFIYGGGVVLLGTVILAMLKLPKTASQMAAEQRSGG